jgi:neopullulanase
MSFFLRGQPVIYYGDEQGFAGSGGDQASRQSMFASKVAAYNAESLVATSATTARDNYDTTHPIFRALAEMAAIRTAEPALRRGDEVVRLTGDGPGLFAVSRRVPGSNAEVLVVFNTDRKPHAAGVEVSASAAGFVSLHGACPKAPFAPGAAKIEAPPLSYIVCKTTIAAP